MATKREVDRAKKSKMRCEHCKYWTDEYSDVDMVCDITGKVRNYYHRCKNFEWKDEE